MTLSLSAILPMEKVSTLCQCIYKTFISELVLTGFVPFTTVYTFRYCVGYVEFPSVLLLKIRNTHLCGMQTEKSCRLHQKCRWTYRHIPLMEKHKQNECREINCSLKTLLSSDLLTPFYSLPASHFEFSPSYTWTATEDNLNGLAVLISFSPQIRPKFLK